MMPTKADEIKNSRSSSWYNPWTRWQAVRTDWVVVTLSVYISVCRVCLYTSHQVTHSIGCPFFYSYVWLGGQYEMFGEIWVVRIKLMKIKWNGTRFKHSWRLAVDKYFLNRINYIFRQIHTVVINVRRRKSPKWNLQWPQKQTALINNLVYEQIVFNLRTSQKHLILIG